MRTKVYVAQGVNAMRTKVYVAQRHTGRMNLLLILSFVLVIQVARCTTDEEAIKPILLNLLRQDDPGDKSDGMHALPELPSDMTDAQFYQLLELYAGNEEDPKLDKDTEAYNILSSLQTDSHYSTDIHTMQNAATVLVQLRDMLSRLKSTNQDTNEQDKSNRIVGKELLDEQSLKSNDAPDARENTLALSLKQLAEEDTNAKMISEALERELTERGSKLDNPLSSILHLFGRNYHETHCTTFGGMCGYFKKPCCNYDGRDQLKMKLCCRKDFYTGAQKGMYGYCLPSFT